MDWRNLALKNIWRNMRRYLGYLLASTMAVTVFGMFFMFIFNPMVGSLTGLHDVAVVMVICVVIVALFAIFFIFYFHSALIRTRNKEFGLLMTLGMTPRQVGRLIFYESICIGLAALLLGLALGALCLQPFQIAMGAVLGLQNTIPFALSPYAILATAAFFGPVFLIEAIVISLRVAHRTPRVLILGARTRQMPPRASILLVIVGLLCLGIAYDQAAQFSRLFIINAIPIVGLTITGTFLLFSQIMVMLLSWLRRRPLHGINLLIVSRLTYRIKDYARMLAVVTVLNAMVLTGMGTVFSFVQGTRADEMETHPLDVQLVESVAHPFKLTGQQMRNTLTTAHLTIQNQLEVPMLSGQVDNTPISVMSLTTFAQLRSTILRIHPDLAAGTPPATDLAPNQAHLNMPYSRINSTPPSLPFALSANHTLNLHVGASMLTLQIDRGATRVFSLNEELSSLSLVVNDQTYANLQKTAPPANQWHLYAFHFPNAQQTLTAVSVLQGQLGDATQEDLGATFSNIAAIQIMSALLFAGCFVSLLFLFAAGSALYFKLFTQQEEDRRQFHALARVGLQKREGVHIISMEFFLLFFLPVLVAIVHSTFATLDLISLGHASSTLTSIIWSAVGVTWLAYAACFAAYYLVALASYFRRVPIATV
jgi:hypothetical protein